MEIQKWLSTGLVVLASLLTFSVMVFAPNKENQASIDANAVQHSVKVLAKLENGAHWGTGTTITKGIILTCAHIFPKDEKYKPQVLFRGHKDFVNSNVLFISRERDLALLFVNDGPQIAEVKHTVNWEYDQPITFVGNSIDDFLVGHSKISGLQVVSDSHGPVLTFPCDKGTNGFSGGGVFNNKGELMGVFQLGFDNIDRCGMIRTTEVLDWIKGLN